MWFLSGYDIVLALHAWRSGRHTIGCNLPLVIILGGTDCSTPEYMPEAIDVTKFVLDRGMLRLFYCDLSETCVNFR